MKDMQEIFFHFMNKEYIYESKTSDLIWSKMNDFERHLFPFDVRKIEWEFCLKGFMFGIRRFFLKEDCLSPDSGFT